MIEIPNPDSVQSVADWVELDTSITHNHVSKAEVVAAIERTAGQEPSDAFVSSLWRELSFRKQSYKQTFFELTNYSLEPQVGGDPPPEYMTCLLLSLYGLPGHTQIPSRLFEKMVCTAVRQYLAGQAVVFGWPIAVDTDELEDEETAIKRMVKSVASEMRERFCEAPAARFKDRGVDVIAWLPFADMRSGQVAVLLQCGAGLNWRNKLPVPLDAWCQYIHWASNPVKAFAVPCVIDNKQWHDISKDRGILFDRIRILNLLPNGVQDPTLRQELKEWVHGQVAELV